jgi:nucleoside-diphosphate-sugar epimerase
MCKTIFVTGAAGFIGSHLCEALLTQGHTVIGIDNFDPFYDRDLKEQNLQICRQSPSFFFYEGDAGDADLLNSLPHKIEVVVHLAAKAGVLPSLKNPKAYIDANISVTNTLLEWMRSKSISKFVFASSSSVYGNSASIPFIETDPVNEPISPYAFTKRSCELMNYTYHNLYGIDVVNLRFFTVYGERQRPDLAIRKFVHRIFSGLSISVYGDGSTARDYTYCKDTVSGITGAIDYVTQHTGVYEIFNLGNNKPITLLELIAAIGKACGKEPILVFEDKKPGDVDITFASIEKAKEKLGYHPQTTLENGMARFVTWYKEQEETVGNRT